MTRNGDDSGLALGDLEDALLLLQIFRILGRLYEANPPLMRDALTECTEALREANNRVATDRGYASIATDDMVRRVCAITGTNRGLAKACANAVLAPSRLANVLDVLRAHSRAYEQMKRKPRTEADYDREIEATRKDLAGLAHEREALYGKKNDSN